MCEVHKTVQVRNLSIIRNATASVCIVGTLLAPLYTTLPSVDQEWRILTLAAMQLPRGVTGRKDITRIVIIIIIQDDRGWL